MPQRQRILLGVLIAMFVLLAGSRTVYPRWIRPLFDVTAELASREAELRSVEAKWNRHLKSQTEYREYVVRSGGTDALQVKNDLQARIVRLISDCNLTSKSITPYAPKEDRRTRVQDLRFDVRAEGALESVIRFVARCEELPQLVCLDEIRLSPASAGRRDQDEDRIALYCRLEAVVPSALDGAMVVAVGPDDQPSTWIRQTGDAETYASIWRATPFTEWKPAPPPPPVELVHRGPEPGTKEPPPPPPKHREDKDTLVDLVAIYGSGDQMVHEVHTIAKRGRSRGQHRSLGDKMDGGKLVMVHPLGAVVRREGEDYFYPRGLTFGESMLLTEADRYPEVIAHMRWLEASGAWPVDSDEDDASDDSGRKGPDGAARANARGERDSPVRRVGAAEGNGRRATQEHSKSRKGGASGRRGSSTNQGDDDASDKTSDDALTDEVVEEKPEGDEGKSPS